MNIFQDELELKFNIIDGKLNSNEALSNEDLKILLLNLLKLEDANENE
jgi:hypothetical protein